MEQDENRFEALLGKFMAGTIMPGEHLEMMDLIGNDDRKQALYEACTGSGPVDQQSVEAAFERHWQQLPSRVHPAGRYFVWRRVVAAAAVLLVLGLVVFQSIYRGNPQTFITQVGERKSVILPDGSTVRLNGGSMLVLDGGFNQANRRITFRGEGYFQIEKDAKRPFTIVTEGTTINVLGTVFNLRAYEEEDKIETALISGRVEFTLPANPAKKIPLQPGKKVSVYKEGIRDSSGTAALTGGATENYIVSDITLSPGQPMANETLWTADKLVFDGDNLVLVASKLEKWYGVEVKIANGANREKKFSAIFPHMELDTVLQALARTGSLRFSRSGESVTLDAPTD
ncbi:MAG: DUF4974 domain-containing protein [Parapedobacter sp.]|mgnify:FL=1|nr:MAG: DUF4974 domain-containing protein [Parapedobacter sp.]